MQIVSIIVSIAVSLIMIGVSFYLYTIYCHPQDKGIGTSVGSKIVVVFCQFLSWGQLLIIPLDIANNLGQDSTSMEILYSTVYIVIFVFTSFIVPFVIFLYEADQEDSLLSRVVWSGLFAFAICAIWCAFVFITYIWLDKYTINGEQGRLPIPLYMMLCMGLIGWVFLAINGGVGLIFLPYQLIRDFFIRPKQLTSQQAFEEKKILQTRSQQLITMGEELKKKQVQLKQGNFNWFIRRKKTTQLKNQVQFYKQQVTKLQNTFNEFDELIGGIKPVKSEKDKKQNAKADKQIQKTIKKNQTSPITYCLYLFFGILASLVSLTWIIQLFGTTIYSNKQPLFVFLDSPLYNLQRQPGIGFLSVTLYSLLVLYLQGSVIKGNIVFGLRIPFIISFHPMIKDRTLLNSFLFNVNIMMLASIATTQLTVLAFPTYLGQSYIGQMYQNKVAYMPLFGFLYRYRIFMAALDIIFLMSLAVVIFRIVKDCCLKGKKKEKESN